MKKHVDAYYHYLDNIRSSWKNRDVSNTLQYCELSLSLIEHLIKDDVKQCGTFAIQSIPAIELGSALHAILGNIGQLDNLKNIVDSFPELEPWKSVVERAYEMRDIASSVYKYVGDNPGCLQKDLKKALALSDGRLLSNVVHYMDACGKLKREATGNSYRLYIAR